MITILLMTIALVAWLMVGAVSYARAIGNGSPVANAWAEASMSLLAIVFWPIFCLYVMVNLIQTRAERESAERLREALRVAMILKEMEDE